MDCFESDEQQILLQLRELRDELSGLRNEVAALRGEVNSLRSSQKTREEETHTLVKHVNHVTRGS